MGHIRSVKKSVSQVSLLGPLLSLVSVNYIIIIDPHLRADDKSPLHIRTNPFTTNIKRAVVHGHNTLYFV